jgi:hypothetical protein
MQRVSVCLTLCYHRGVRWSPVASTCLVFFLLISPLEAQDALGEARRLYNAGLFEEAERQALIALEQPPSANSARLVLGRIQLERFRKAPTETLLGDARRSLRDVDPAALDPRERIELTIGFAETLFLEDKFLAAARMFEPILSSSLALGAAAHSRVLDWWATALDRHAQTRRMEERVEIYAAIRNRMNAELAQDPGSTPAGYWVVAAARGSGDLDSAWSAASASWIRAALAPDRGVILRGDLDRLVVHALIPERAARLSPKDPSLALTGLLSEWEAFKANWTK